MFERPHRLILLALAMGAGTASAHDFLLLPSAFRVNHSALESELPWNQSRRRRYTPGLLAVK